MKTIFNFTLAAWSFVLLAGVGAGCSGGGTAAPGADATSEVPAEGGVLADAAPVDAPPSDSAAEVKPTIHALSPAGHDRLFSATFDAQGNLFAIGSIAAGTAAIDDHESIVVKLLPTGALDKTFGKDGIAKLNLAVGTGGEVARGLVVQSTGKIVIAATVEHVAPGSDPRDRDLAVARFNADGTVDTAFGVNGVVLLDLSDGELVGTTYVADTQWGLNLFSDDRLLVTGALKATGRTDTDFAVVKLTANGERDATFGTNGLATLDINRQSASPKEATLLADGSVVASGYNRDADGLVSPVLYKLTPAGQLDTTFGVNGVFNEIVLPFQAEIYGVSQQGTRFVTAGYGKDNAQATVDWVSLRILANGKRDLTYGTNGIARVDLAGQNDNARSIATLPDNRVLLLGSGRSTAANGDAMLVMLTADGSPDTTFAPLGRRVYDLGGPGDAFWGAALSPDKKRVAVVGVKGANTNADAGAVGNDDGAVLILPLQ